MPRTPDNLPLKPTVTLTERIRQTVNRVKSYARPRSSGSPDSAEKTGKKPNESLRELEEAYPLFCAELRKRGTSLAVEWKAFVAAQKNTEYLIPISLDAWARHRKNADFPNVDPRSEYIFEEEINIIPLESSFAQYRLVQFLLQLLDANETEKNKQLLSEIENFLQLLIERFGSSRYLRCQVIDELTKWRDSQSKAFFKTRVKTTSDSVLESDDYDSPIATFIDHLCRVVREKSQGKQAGPHTRHFDICNQAITDIEPSSPKSAVARNFKMKQINQEIATFQRECRMFDEVTLYCRYIGHTIDWGELTITVGSVSLDRFKTNANLHQHRLTTIQGIAEQLQKFFDALEKLGYTIEALDLPTKSSQSQPSAELEATDEVPNSEIEVQDINTETNQ
jgi:hypothetical protein